MKSFRSRLTLIIISLVSLSMLAVGLFMGHMFKERYMDMLQESMLRELRLIAASLEWQNGELAQRRSYYEAEARRLKGLTGQRVTFLLNDGTVAGDSDYNAEQMENHRDREEIVGAQQGAGGRAVRQSETTGEKLFYVALAVPDNPADIGTVRMAMSLTQIDAIVNRLWLVLGLSMLVLLVVAVTVSYRLASSLTRPLEQISRVAKRIKNLDYESRVKVRKQDEIGELGHSINAMADSLHDQMRRIRQNEMQLQSVLDNMINGIMMIDRKGQIVLINRRAEEILGIFANDVVGRPYHEIKQQYELAQIIQEALESRSYVKEELTFYFPEERLLELNLVPVISVKEAFGGVLLVLQDVSAIRRLERMRSEFVANVSHELKTPIAAVKGFAETLLGGAVDDPEVARSFLQIIYDESERLNRLIGDVLELSKVESRRIPLQFSPIELKSFVARAIEFIAAEATRKGIRLQMDVPDGTYVEADEDRLRQILMNLLSNGINYTPEGGQVYVKVETLFRNRPPGEGGSARLPESDEEYIRISISDTGIGIPAKDQPRIFERFYRVDKARSRSSGGTGLGLSIVKHLVELHKGTITVESKVGIGTTFVIELPVIH